MQRRTKKHPILFWKKEEKKVDCYQRLMILVKLRKHKRLPPHINTDGVFVKMFKDIPKLDLEMLLPGARPKMPGLERGKFGASLLGSLSWIAYKIFTEMAELATALSYFRSGTKTRQA